ncbi:MAG: hypothetical protein ACJA2C_002222 [Marinoscillum sp.]|jgi:hypothetical protein
MKKITLYIILAGATLIGFAQKLEKYEEVLPRFLAMPPSGTLAELKIYLAQEYDNGSIYLQMGLVYEKRYRKSDPITDYAYKVGNAQEALNAYRLAEQFITEKVVKKNQEYFFNFGKLDEKGRLNVEYDTIKNHLTKVQAELKRYVANVPTIYEKFTKSFSSYDQAHKRFSQILGKYPTFKDLYLLYNDEVDQEFKEIKEDYLASLAYWKEYKSASDTFDVGYHQKMSVQPIKVYRLDGLESKINFLKDDIKVWDYATWVDETRATIKSEIDKLRIDLAAENVRLDKELNNVAPSIANESFEPLKVSKEILFTLRKYDLNSVIEPIFLFKEKQHDLLHQQLINNKIAEDENSTVERKLYMYGQTINKIKDADSVLIDVRRRNTKASFEKYPNLINTSYQGQSGITTFISSSISSNNAQTKQYVDNIQTELYQLLKTDSIIPVAKYKKSSFPLRSSLSMDKEQLTEQKITTHRIENFDGSAFIAGVFLNAKEAKVQAYVAGVAPDKTIGWYNEYLLQLDSTVGFDSDTRIGAIQTVPGGLAVILSGVDGNGSRLNHLMMLDEKGIVTFNRRLMLDKFPRNISYNERTNTLFVTYKGDDYGDDIFMDSELIMASYSIYGDLQWQKRLSYKGDIADVVNVDQGYLIVGNYNELKGLDGKVKRAGTSNIETKLFTLKVNLAGEIIDLKTVDYGSSFYTNKIYKVSDDCINLFGSKGAYEKKLAIDDEPGSAVHIIMNKDLEVIANSLN